MQTDMYKKDLVWMKTGTAAKDYWFRSVFSMKTLFKWLLIGTVLGVVVGLVGAAFAHSLAFVNDFRTNNGWVRYLLPVGGLVIVFLYRFFKNTGDRGTNMVISSIYSSVDVPFRMAPLIYISTVITHLCGGSAGREGAAIQLGGSIANRMGKIFKLNENDRRVIIMCGMSAGFSALFGTPLAAAIFSMEVISVGIMHYSALVPCVTASVIANLVAKFCQVPPEVFPVANVPVMDAVAFFKMVLFAVCIGAISILFCMVLHGMELAYRKYLKNPYVRIFCGGLMVVGFTCLLGTDQYLGSGMGIIEHIFHEGETQTAAFLLKILFTALTLGAGFKGGEIVPSFCIGASFGCITASLLGLPLELVTACGMVGLFCGVTNCPLTSLLISFELFGFEGMLYYLVTISVSYMLSGNYGLYRAQKNHVFQNRNPIYQRNCTLKIKFKPAACITTGCRQFYAVVTRQPEQEGMVT